MPLLLLTSLPNDCLVQVAQLLPARCWPQLRATCRDLRAAVRDATTGLVVDLRSLPFSTPVTPTASSSALLLLPKDQLLLSRVREVRILLHKDRDECNLTTKGLGEAAECPVAPLLREIERARASAAAAAAAAADTNAAANARRRPLPPLRVSLCLRAPRGFIELPEVPEWLCESGIAALVNGVVDLRADGAVCAALEGTNLNSPGPLLLPSSTLAASAIAFRGFPPDCQGGFRVEMKFSFSEPYCEGALLLMSLAGVRVSSLSVLSFPVPFLERAAAAAEHKFGRCVGLLFSETLEELRLAESVYAWAVRSALTGGGGSDGGEEGKEPRGCCHWPALRRLVLLGSPHDGDGELDPFFADGGREEEEQEQPFDLFPSLETLFVKAEHAGAWLRRLGDAIDLTRVALERL